MRVSVQIASLRGELQRVERQHNEKVRLLEKEKQDAVHAAIEKFRQAAKAVSDFYA